MVNGYFFTLEDESAFRNFHSKIPNNASCLCFCDPPFSAPLSLVIKQIQQLSSCLASSTHNENHESVPQMFALPYFFEKKLKKIAPHLSLLDYKITYEKHSRLDSNLDCGVYGKGQRRDSVVRLFTSRHPSDIPPPSSLSHFFRFCQPCGRYSHTNNKHCDKCGNCTTKHGPTYVHCDQCGRCRSPRKVHCDQCAQCVPLNQCQHQ